MTSNRLSRWTLLFFACALVNFLAAEGLILAGMTWPFQQVAARGTLIAVHLLTIGWLLLLMLGALLQFVPVITSRPLMSQRLSLATLILVQVGLLAMICGFLGIAAGRSVLALALPTGGTMVLLGALVACLNLGAPLLRSRPLPLPGRMVLAGLAFLLLTIALGLSFALALTIPAVAPPLAPLLARIADHALAGLGGWFTLTAMGVSYKLIPMFLLAPEERGIPGRCVYLAATAGFALAIAAGLIRIWIPDPVVEVAEMAGYAAILLAIGIYLWDVRRIYRARRRSVIEAHNRAAVGAFGLLGLAALLAIVFLATGRPAGGEFLVVFLILFGWLGGLGLTQLYKIIPFLTWLSRYGNSLGRTAVPRVQDLVKENRAYPCFIAYFAGTLLAALAIFFDRLDAFRACMTLATLATVGLLIEYWHAWRAHYVQLRAVTSAVPPFIHDQRG